MADIDGFLIIGDEVITGGEGGVKPTTALPQFAGLATLMPELNRVVPSGADGVTGGLYYPYYDITYVKSWAATAGGASTITVASAQWKTNHYAGRTLTITAGTGSGQTRTVSSNTATQATVSVAWVTPPDATSVFNFGAGEFVPFHYMANTLIPGANGDNHWISAGTTHQNITPTVMLMQKLGRKYGVATPGFRVLKKGAPDGVGVWATGQSFWNDMKANWNDMVGIEEGKGNTLRMKAVIFDGATRDIFDLNLNFQAELDAFIDSVRADFGSDALIVIVMPHDRAGYTTYAAFTAGIRQAIRNTVAARKAAGDANIRTYDMSWANFAMASLVATTVEPTDPRYYDLPSILLTGVGLYNTIEGWLASTSLTQPAGTVLPAVGMVGTSQMVGLTSLIAYYANQESFLGPLPNTALSNTWIWDDAGQALVPMDVMSNTNTWGQPAVTSASELTLAKAVRKRYPQGCVIIKYAKGGVALTPEAMGTATGYIERGGTIFDDIRDKVGLAKISAIRDLGATLDVIGLALDYGENDVGPDAIAAYEARLPASVDDFREIFCTRADGFLPVSFMQPPPPAASVAGGSTLGTAENRDRIRAAVLALETSKTNLKVVRNSGPDDFELSRDTVHYGGEAQWKIGYAHAENIFAIIDSVEGGTATVEETADEPSGSAAFVEEDGSGLTSANALCSVSFVDTWAAENGNPSGWITASQAKKKDCIRQATRWVSTKFKYDGARVKQAQALAFPRVGIVDVDGWTMDSNAVPTAVKQAVSVVAIKICLGTFVPFPDEAFDAGKSSGSISIGPISLSDSYAGARDPSTETRLPMVLRLLDPFLSRASRRLTR